MALRCTPTTRSTRGRHKDRFFPVANTLVQGCCFFSGNDGRT